MTILTVSGHARKTGKTTVAEGLIAAFPQCGWAALKISSHWHSTTLENYLIIEEQSREGLNDTSRFLAAGAKRAWWARVREGQMEAAMPEARKLLESEPFILIEGNEILDFISADFRILVLNDAVAEFKKSARRILQQADALLTIRNPTEATFRREVVDFPAATPFFETDDPKVLPSELLRLIRSRLHLASTQESF